MGTRGIRTEDYLRFRAWSKMALLIVPLGKSPNATDIPLASGPVIF